MARIGEIVDRVNFALGKVENGFYSPTDIVRELNVESFNLFKYLHSRFSETKRISEYLQPFMVRGEEISINDSGIGTKPEGFQHHMGSYTSSSVKVDLLETNFWVQRIGHPNKGPSATHPIMRMIGSNVEVLPLSINTILLDYLKLPTKAVYAFNVVDDEVEYDDDNSTDWEWDNEIVEDLIINRSLANFGINIKDGDLINYSNLEEAKQ